MTARICIIFFGLLICTAALQGQEGITVQTVADKNRILIGEQLQLTITANYKTGTLISLPVADSVVNFEPVGKPVIDSSAKAGITSLKAIYTFTSFDSGQWVIPAFDLAAGIHTDAIPVEVVFADFDPKQPYHDITGVEDVPVQKNEEPWWWYAAGAALLALGIFILFRKKKQAGIPATAPPVAVNAFAEAIQQLDALQNKNCTPKEYYSELTDIFRVYIYRRKGILSLQKTTDDLVVQLKTLSLEKEQFDKLSQSLQMSDFVKFARYVPAAADNRICLEEIKKSVLLIEQIEKNRLTAGRK
jgi:LPXTG-motif cell wall-anchored protein